jgi:hypothetical protein
MVEYLLNKLCNLFGYTIIPVVECYTPQVKCTNDMHCECYECMPW